jgi:acetyltransferase-like isoleucine patch superfamily enzyme
LLKTEHVLPVLNPMPDIVHTSGVGDTLRQAGLRSGVLWRIGWTVLTISLVQIVVCAAALFPVVLIWSHFLSLTESSRMLRAVVLSIVAVPSYALFALLLMLFSAVTVRTLNWRTPPNLEMRIADVGWPLLQWVRSMVATHIVRFIAGGLFRGSPIWTAYLRLAGARLGHRVYVNSLAVTDYNLLEFGNDVVIGDHVHLSGHTVEGGFVKTAPVRLGSHVTVGLGSVVDIGAEIGDGCQVGALSFVPKHTRLEAGAIYAGVPVHRLG